jgi:hypothetical protein
MSIDLPELADGFSCRHQIAQLTGRRVWHTAEIVARALRAAQAKPEDEDGA